ncbi:MAG: hypothetical protein ACLTXL_00755 [Clostridia bacterium]
MIISIHVPRKRDDDGSGKEGEVIYISIHVPCKRDDLVESAMRCEILLFNPRPRKRDDPEAGCPSGFSKFQSTSPARGTTS